MKIKYIADDGKVFFSEAECVAYEKSSYPVYYAVDIYRTGGTRHHHETVLGVFFTKEEAHYEIDKVNNKRAPDLNQRYEVRTTTLLKSLYKGESK